MCEYREGYFTIPDFQWCTVSSKMKLNEKANKQTKLSSFLQRVISSYGYKKKPNKTKHKNFSISVEKNPQGQVVQQPHVLGE